MITSRTGKNTVNGRGVDASTTTLAQRPYQEAQLLEDDRAKLVQASCLKAVAPAIGLLAGNPDKRRLLTEVAQASLATEWVFADDPRGCDCQGPGRYSVTDVCCLKLPEEWLLLRDWLLEHSARARLLGAGEIRPTTAKILPAFWEGGVCITKLLPLMGPVFGGQLPSMLAAG